MNPAIPSWFKRINKIVEIPYEKTKWFYQEFLGVTHHAVFMYDYHFQNYHYNFKIEAVDTNLKSSIVPFLNEDGLVKNSYANGALWVNYTFRVNSPRFKLKQFEEGTNGKKTNHKTDKVICVFKLYSIRS